MNTATQLLEQCIKILDEGIHDYVNRPQLLEDIEAYLAKQQVEQEPMYLVFYSDADTPDVWIRVDKKRFDGTKEDYRLAVYASPQAREPSTADEYKQGYNDSEKMAQKQNQAWVEQDAAWQKANTKNLQRIAELEKIVLKSREPIYTTGAPLIFAIGLINSDLTLIENIKTREDLNIVIKSIRDQLQVISVYANKIIAPQPREPMSEDEIELLHLNNRYFWHKNNWESKQ
jgi:hypothetical protein